MRKFRVGDKVKAVTNRYGTTNACYNYEGIVVRVDENGRYIDVKTTRCTDMRAYSEGYTFTYLWAADFELLKKVYKVKV